MIRTSTILSRKIKENKKEDPVLIVASHGGGKRGLIEGGGEAESFLDSTSSPIYSHGRRLPMGVFNVLLFFFFPMG